MLHCQHNKKRNSHYHERTVVENVASKLPSDSIDLTKLCTATQFLWKGNQQLKKHLCIYLLQSSVESKGWEFPQDPVISVSRSSLENSQCGEPVTSVQLSWNYQQWRTGINNKELFDQFSWQNSYFNETQYYYTMHVCMEICLFVCTDNVYTYVLHWYVCVHAYKLVLISDLLLEPWMANLQKKSVKCLLATGWKYMRHLL